jgi:hypothetical protein
MPENVIARSAIQIKIPGMHRFSIELKMQLMNDGSRNILGFDHNLIGKYQICRIGLSNHPLGNTEGAS